MSPGWCTLAAGVTSSVEVEKLQVNQWLHIQAESDSLWQLGLDHLSAKVKRNLLGEEQPKSKLLVFQIGA